MKCRYITIKHVISFSTATEQRESVKVRSLANESKDNALELEVKSVVHDIITDVEKNMNKIW